MEIVGAIVLFVVFIFVYLIIAEIFVMLFRITGMTDEKARFQVISMLTNSGYTTKEAELVLDSRIRRKLARFVMMFGYAFTVTIVSTVVNIFLQFRHTLIGGAIAFIPIVVLVILLTWLVKKNRWINSMIDKFIRKIANKLIYDEKSNPIIIIDDYGDVVLAKVELMIIPNQLDNITLHDSNIKREYGINIMLKKTDNEEILPDANTKFNVGDIIVVMGKKKKIWELFDIHQSK